MAEATPEDRERKKYGSYYGMATLNHLPSRSLSPFGLHSRHVEVDLTHNGPFRGLASKVPHSSTEQHKVFIEAVHGLRSSALTGPRWCGDGAGGGSRT